MDTIECIMNRAMCRDFTDKPVEDDKIRKIIEAGVRAPSAKNRQPWYFVVIKDQELKKKLEAISVRGRLAQFKNRSEKELKNKIIENKTPEGGNDRCIRKSQVCVLACWDKSKMEKAGEADKDALQIKEIQGVSAAVQNMCLAAFALGLGAAWICSPLYIKRELGEELGLRENIKPLAFVCIGYPAKETKPTPRDPASRVSKTVK